MVLGSAPFSVVKSGPLTERTIPAPLSTSARLPSFAPAASNSASGMEAPSPAPPSTANSAPSAMNFSTASGIAAQRVSPAASLITPIFTRLIPDQQNDEPDDQTGDRAIGDDSSEGFVVAHMGGDIRRRRIREKRFFLFGHFIPLCGCPSVRRP